ncbi:uncharacterized protein LY79DRAFT_357668 [Colletotrichum navitas]|uniref:Uncharacterized protein n=1 Tax=Colletotrichum navitas TaxID=681940 RepID=A0AAD8PS92_9PEZI|nr:uncharacterized protein LY79DRAFT_357668 [Colletotrichum navitas]KAK1579149.1 hypothetical protein LY79DRAFT_357668 [Colletotrichum navitas]
MGFAEMVGKFSVNLNKRERKGKKIKKCLTLHTIVSHELQRPSLRCEETPWGSSSSPPPPPLPSRLGRPLEPCTHDVGFDTGGALKCQGHRSAQQSGLAVGVTTVVLRPSALIAWYLDRGKCCQDDGYPKKPTPGTETGRKDQRSEREKKPPTKTKKSS